MEFQRFKPKNPQLSSWWLNQPIWKTLVQIGSFPQVRVKMKKYWKPPPPSFFCWVSHQPPVKYPPIFNGSSNLCTTTSPSGIQHQEHSLEDSYAVVFGTKGGWGECHMSTYLGNFSPIFQSIYLSMVWFLFWLQSWVTSIPNFFGHWTVPSGNHGRLEKFPHFSIVGNTSSNRVHFSIAMLVYPGVFLHESNMSTNAIYRGENNPRENPVGG